MWAQRDIGTIDHTSGAAEIPPPLGMRDQGRPITGPEAPDRSDYAGGIVVRRSSQRWSGTVAILTDLDCADDLRLELRADTTRLSAILETGGRVQVDVDGERATVAPNRTGVSVVPACRSAALHATKAGRVRHLLLRFDELALEDLLGGSGDLRRAFASRASIQDDGLIELCRLFATECDVGRTSSRLFGDSLSIALVLRLSRLNNDQLSVQTGGGLAPWQLRRVFDYFEAHFEQNISLAALASLVRLSSSHFSRAFKASTGLSPYRWLVDLRCAKARAFLLDGRMDLAEIAVAAGFCDQSHLTRVFTRTNGLPPAAWRRARVASVCPARNQERRVLSRALPA